MVKKEIKVEVIYTDGYEDRIAKALAKIAQKHVQGENTWTRSEEYTDRAILAAAQ